MAYEVFYSKSSSCEPLSSLRKRGRSRVKRLFLPTLRTAMPMALGLAQSTSRFLAR